MRRLRLIWLVLVPLAALAQDSLKCCICGKEFDGRYLSSDDKLYHEECFAAGRPKCGYCGKPVVGSVYYEQDGVNYHKNCYIDHICPKCDLCGEALTGEFSVDIWGIRIHKEHKAEINRCDFCIRIISEKISEGGGKYNDGRLVCGICYKTMIRDSLSLNSLIADMSRVLRENGMEVDMSKVPVIITDRKTLNRIAQSDNPQQQGFYYWETETTGDKSRLKKSMIYMIKGLPRRNAEGILAHEMGHVWMVQSGITELPLWLNEGTASYASYLALKQHSDKLADLLIENIRDDPDEVYGEGFRRVLKYAEKKGTKKLLKALKEKGRID